MSAVELDKLLERCNHHLDKIESGEILLIKNPNFPCSQVDNSSSLKMTGLAVGVSIRKKPRKKSNLPVLPETPSCHGDGSHNHKLNSSIGVEVTLPHLVLTK